MDLMDVTQFGDPGRRDLILSSEPEDRGRILGEARWWEKPDHMTREHFLLDAIAKGA